MMYEQSVDDTLCTIHAHTYYLLWWWIEIETLD